MVLLNDPTHSSLSLERHLQDNIQDVKNSKALSKYRLKRLA